MRDLFANESFKPQKWSEFTAGRVKKEILKGVGMGRSIRVACSFQIIH